MGPHVPLVLLQDNGTAGNGSRIIGIHLTRLKLSLTMTTQRLVDNRSENARTSRKESIKGMQYRQLWIGTKGGIDIDRGESIANVVDNSLNGLG